MMKNRTSIQYFYENGIVGYVNEINQDKGFTEVKYYETYTKEGQKINRIQG